MYFRAQSYSVKHIILRRIMRDEEGNERDSLVERGGLRQRVLVKRLCLEQLGREEIEGIYRGVLIQAPRSLSILVSTLVGEI